MKIFILTFSLVQHWNRSSIININEFLTTSPRTIPLVLASLCRNCLLTFNLFVYLLFRDYCQFISFVENISYLLLSDIDFTYLLTNPLLLRSCVKPPFGKFGWRFNPPFLAERVGGGIQALLHRYYPLTPFCFFFKFLNFQK